MDELTREVRAIADRAGWNETGLTGLLLLYIYRHDPKGLVEFLEDMADDGA
jgi:hypothetical protein